MFLGIDIGTSAVKAILMDAEGTAAARASAPLTVQSPNLGWSEQDPTTWWTAALAVCATLRRDAETAYGAIAAIGLSGQMHGAVCLDAALAPIRPAILWNDGRSGAECAEMAAALPGLAALAGVPPTPSFTAPKILWLKRREPESYARIAHILPPKDYVRLRLTGGLATDMADAAGTLWLDQAKRGWSETLCRVSATDPAWLPRLCEGTQLAGALTEAAAMALGLTAGLPVAAGGGDAAAGAVGIGAMNQGDAFISLGTSGQLFAAADSYRPNPAGMVHAFAHAVPDRWFQMAAMLNGARPLQWWSETTGVEIADLLAEVENDIGKDPGRAPLFLPYLTGERTPHNDAAIRGGFYGLENDTSRAEMTRAVIDAVAYSFCDARDALAGAGTRVTAPSAIGGGARSDLLLQTMADATGFVIRRRKDADAGPAYGAARLAAASTGAITLSELAQTPPLDRQFDPDPHKAAHHAERLARYRALYAALAPFAAG
ncbi:MAG: xylulokinase [Alphaproteobacteria bacterium]|nr:xylulokinase [Alphaproteobacteria bacterium]